jgi:hypothetical protein
MACQVTPAVLLQKTKNNSSNNAWQDIKQFLVYSQQEKTVMDDLIFQSLPQVHL